MNTAAGPDPWTTLSSMGVEVQNLVVGRPYLIISYLDDDCLVPVIDSLVFLGKDVEGHGEPALYFQDAESYREQGAFPNIRGDDARIVITGLEIPPNIFELEGAVDELRRCVERNRRIQPA